MKKLSFLIFFVLFGFCCNQASYGIPNPWIDCGDDISCGAKKAGFNLPLRVNNYSVRAMEDMIEIKFPLDKKRMVTIRKSQLYYGNNGDNSGVFYNYPVNKTITLKNGILFNTKGDRKNIYVTNFAAESGYYSAFCEKGLSLKDINKLYEILAEAEAPRSTNDEKENYSLEQLQDLRRIDGIVEPVFTQNCFPRTLEKKGVTKNCFERANMGEDSVCSESEIKMIKEYYKKGYKCDPLNNGTGGFCAEE